MKENKEFNNILDECVERLLRGETIEQCLQRYPEQAAELEPLLQTALAASKASTIQPRAEFKARARYQFGSALQEIEAKKGYRFFGWLPRWATVVTVVVILLLLGGSTVVAAGNSMPDGSLYPVKLATEQVRVRLTPSALGRAQLYARLADKRVAEIIYMASKGDPEQVGLVTQRLNTHLAMIASLARAQRGKNGVLLAPPAIERASEDTEGVSPQAGKRAKLRLIVGRYAANHPARLRAALGMVPAPAKPALRRAIGISVIGYDRALKAIGERDN